jgi:ABC-type glycerol-3-phosphate transport system substrate-binding protein
MSGKTFAERQTQQEETAMARPQDRITQPTAVPASCSLTRRHLIKLTGGAAAGLAVAPYWFSRSASADDKEITVAYDSPQFWKDQAAEFTEATGIKVNYEDVPFPQLHDRYLTSFVGGSGDLDVVHLRDDWAAEFGSKGFLVPLGDRVTDELRKQFVPRGFDYLTYQDQVYGVPRYLWLWQFYYNTDFAPQPPTTWEEFESLAEQQTKDGHYGAIMTLGSTLSINHFTIHLRAQGAELLDDDGKATFNTPEGKTALQQLVTMAEKKLIDPSSFELTTTGNTMDIFNQGNIAMMLNTPQVFASANDPEKSKVVGKVAVAVVPGAKLKSASYSELGAVGIPSASSKQDLAWQYCEFVTNAEQQKKMALVLGRIPTRPAILNDQEVQAKYPNFDIVADQVQYPMGMSVAVPQSSEVNDALSKELVSAIRGDKSVDDALADGEKAVNQITGK